MSSSLKTVSVSKVEEAISKVLSELTENECTVFISNMKFEVNTLQSLIGGETVTFSATATLKPTDANEPAPF
jgi:hypothetical protein